MQDENLLGILKRFRQRAEQHYDTAQRAASRQDYSEARREVDIAYKISFIVYKHSSRRLLQKLDELGKALAEPQRDRVKVTHLEALSHKFGRHSHELAKFLANLADYSILLSEKK